jgi:hypothetical protein
MSTSIDGDLEALARSFCREGEEISSSVANDKLEDLCRGLELFVEKSRVWPNARERMTLELKDLQEAWQACKLARDVACGPFFQKAGRIIARCRQL